jgi:hypothetical protein
MDLRAPALTSLIAAALCAALAAPAVGGPAGDEYQLKVPKASGESESHNRGSGASEETSSSSETTTTDSETQGAAPAGGGGGDPGKGEGAEAKKDPDPAPTPISGAPASSSDDSSDSTLFSPVALLLIAGVLIAVVGMTLRRRNTGGDERQEGTGASRPERGKTPPTPDGEIVAGGDQAS